MPNSLMDQAQLKQETRQCSSCAAVRPAAEFRSGRRRCAACRRAEKRASYAKHKESVLAYQAAYRSAHAAQIAAHSFEYRQRNLDTLRQKDRLRYERAKTYLLGLKKGPCADCSLVYPPECMDFDHIRGSKVESVGRLVTYARSVVNAEVAKTELVCACCHRIRTAVRKGSRVYPVSMLAHFIDELKISSACSDCAKFFPAVCMDFDHVDPATKEYEIGWFRVERLTKLDVLKTELAKCALRCANCHRIKTVRERLEARNA
jgi:5-methylcytosine-specific restriction endonuclease McrA